MADQVNYQGRLIAVDGTRGKDVTAAANALAAELKRHGIECGVSRWDASGLFAELAASGRAAGNISARGLSLVYAADLAFRLRWEIRPILESGGYVIAASYVDTAAAFGVSCGLSDDWLRELMRFAPSPHFRGRAEERKANKPWKHRLDRGYCEYAAALLADDPAAQVSTKGRRVMMAALDAARGRKPYDLADAGRVALAKVVTGSRKAASRRSASRLRSARK